MIVQQVGLAVLIVLFMVFMVGARMYMGSEEDE